MNENQKAGIATRVRAGAELLDSARPEWAEEIDVDLLRIKDANRCILGQVFGTGYSRAVLSLGLAGVDQEHGFDLTHEEYYSANAEEFEEELERHWRKAIAERTGGCHE